MATDKNKKTIANEADTVAKIKRMALEAINVSDDNITAKQAKSFRLYMRKPMPGDDKFEGRSKYVSDEVKSAVDWSVATVARVFDSQREPVSFQPNTATPQDQALAKQMTQVVNFIMRDKNKHVGMLMPWLKNGFMTGLGVTTVSFRPCVEQSLPKTLKGVTQQALVQLHDQEEAGEIEIVAVDGPYKPELPANAVPIMADLIPEVYDVKLRKNKRIVELEIENLPPEDFIVSKDAKFDQQTGGIKARLQGHRRVVSRADLLEQYPDAKAKVNAIPSAVDKDDELALERSAGLDHEQGIGDVNDDVFVFEVYTKMAIDDDKPRHYRLTLGGDISNHCVLLDHVEVSKFYPYAAFCPYPLPNTLFGEGIADRIGPEQNYISKMMRFVFDDLAWSANPIKVIDPNLTNPNDALNLYPGATIRSEDPEAGIKWASRQFTGGNSLSVIQSVSGKLDFATGVGPNMISINASDLQNSTATAASQRANSSQLFMELICRWFAETGYAYLVKLIVDALISNPEDAQLFIQRLTDNFVPMQVDDWDPDMDVSANVAFGVMNKDFNAAMLGQILGQQMQAMQMGLVSPEKISNTLTKIVENAGFTNPYDFYLTAEEIQAKQAADKAAAAQQQPQISPDTQGLIQIEQTKAQLRAQSDEASREFEMRKLIVQNDLDRDRMAQDREIKIAEIQARFGAQVDIARLNAEQAARRNDVDLAMADIDQQNAAMEQLAQIKQAEQAAEAQQQSEAMAHLAQMQQPQQPPMSPQE